MYCDVEKERKHIPAEEHVFLVVLNEGSLPACIICSFTVTIVVDGLELKLCTVMFLYYTSLILKK
jgi:hypothetical protein